MAWTFGMVTDSISVPHASNCCRALQFPFCLSEMSQSSSAQPIPDWQVPRTTGPSQLLSVNHSGLLPIGCRGPMACSSSQEHRPELQPWFSEPRTTCSSCHRHESSSMPYPTPIESAAYRCIAGAFPYPTPRCSTIRANHTSSRSSRARRPAKACLSPTAAAPSTTPQPHSVAVGCGRCRRGGIGTAQQGNSF